MATFYAGMRHYIQALNNLAAIAGLDTFTFSLANDDAISWAGATSTDVHDCLKLDTSDDFNVGLLTAPGSGGALKWWANGAEKARILATGALLVGATSAIAGETILANVAAITPVSNTVVGVLASGAGQSTATTSIRGFESRVTTDAAAFTATELSHFKATGAAAGAGSTITSLYGVKVDNAAAVGASNYAFWTDFASAANKYAIYASGTAYSYLGGNSGIKATPQDDRALNLAQPSGTGVSQYGLNIAVTSPATATTAFHGVYSSIGSAASAYTVTALNHFVAASSTKGAGSTITNVRGFYAANAIVNDTAASTTSGFYSDINAGASATVYQIYAAGNAPSHFQAGVGISSTNAVTPSTTTLLVGRTAAQTGTVANMVSVSSTAPSTATSAWRGFYVNLQTSAVAFTVSELTGFRADTFTKGAGSTISGCYGFIAGSGIAVGATNFGFWSNIAAATNTYQIYMSGTAFNYMLGETGIGGAPSSGTSLVVAVSSRTTSSVYAIRIDGVFAASTTGSGYGVYSALQSAASSYTQTALAHYSAFSTTLGSTSAITTVYGFQALSGIAVGGTNFGFYSNIASASNTYQIYMAGTAKNLLKGGLILDTTAAPTVGAGQIGLGATVQTTVGAAGGASALPATPTGYMIINVAGTNRVIPYFAAS